ncbi:MAG: 30S ribosome-binding factor RbfA [Candidatus Sumerlaeota bacterium]|nr:30S ribosome-binding factor RbfA [Candidatus Sumerlaeota bacterium]
MTYSRMPRVDEVVKEALAEIIHEEITDPRIGFATVAHVKVSKDLRQAVVGISLLDDSVQAVEMALEALEHAQGFIRHELAARVKLKYVPELRFIHDGSAAYASHIGSLLKEIEPDEGWGAAPEAVEKMAHSDED